MTAAASAGTIGPIADEDWPPATLFAQAFRRLAEQQVLSPATALAQAAGLRNLVAHGHSGGPGMPHPGWDAAPGLRLPSAAFEGEPDCDQDAAFRADFAT